MVALDLTLGLTLIWPMAESGLALSTAISAVVQLFLLMWLFARKYASLRLERPDRHDAAHAGRLGADGGGVLFRPVLVPGR